MQLDSRGVEGRIKWRARLWRIRRSRPSSVAASKQTQNVITRQPCYVVELCLRTVYVYLAPDLTVTHFLLAGGPQLSLSLSLGRTRSIYTSVRTKGTWPLCSLLSRIDRTCWPNTYGKCQAACCALYLDLRAGRK